MTDNDRMNRKLETALEVWGECLVPQTRHGMPALILAESLANVAADLGAVGGWNLYEAAADILAYERELSAMVLKFDADVRKLIARL